MDSDREEVQRSAKISPLDGFVEQFLMFKFGHIKLVKARLVSLINSVFNMEGSDHLVNLFGRCTGMLVRRRALRVSGANDGKADIL